MILIKNKIFYCTSSSAAKKKKKEKKLLVVTTDEDVLKVDAYRKTIRSIEIFFQFHDLKCVEKYYCLL